MRILYFLSLLLLSLNAFSQTALVKGKVIHENSKLPFIDVAVIIPKLKLYSTSDANGEFQFNKVPYGEYSLTATSESGEEVTLTIKVNDKVVNLDAISLVDRNRQSTVNLPDNSANDMEDAGSEDENVSSSAGQNVSSILGAARDPFMQAATFGWGQYFFRMRGYEQDYNQLFLNGVPMNDLEEGGVFFNAWSGLNDVFRGQNVSLGLAPTEYNFGGLGLNTALDASASNQRKGIRLTYTLTNRNYRNRIMATMNSGLMKNGWAYSFSLSKRWANEGNVPGTFFDAYAYFGAIEKRFKKQGFSLMVLGSPIRRGKAGPATEEMFNLVGSHYYNPYWGYQNGVKRNSRILTVHQPMLLLTHDAHLGTNTVLTTAIAYQNGENAQTRLDRFNSFPPDPTYYRNLPSYYDDDPVQQALLTENIKANPNLLQVNWDHFYEANRLSTLSGLGRCSYFLAEDVEYTKKWSGAINLETLIKNHVTFYSGLNYQYQNNHNFARVADLLGGSYVSNTNQFAARNFPGLPNNIDMFNVGETNTKKQVGDTYQYDYNIHFSRAAWFSQAVFNYSHFDFFVANELGFTGFYRTGNYKQGYYQNTSLGNSSSLNFFTSKVKGGVTWKLNGRNYFYANGAVGNKAPFVDNVIASPRTRNLIISNPTTEKFQSAEVGYLLRSPNVKARFTGFVTDVKDASDIKRYFADDSSSFANLVLQGINKRFTGVEAGADIKLSPIFSLNLAASFTQAFNTSRPYFNIYSDNDTLQGINSSIYTDTAYIKYFYLPSGPQSAAQVSLKYQNKRYWIINVTGNYLGRNYIDYSPLTRTRDGVDLQVLNSPKWNMIVDQPQLTQFVTLDLSAYKSFKVNKYFKKAGSNTYLNLNLIITNALNNQNIQLYGFENLRRRQDELNVFGSRFAYALGRQYFINFVLRF